MLYYSFLAFVNLGQLGVAPQMCMHIHSLVYELSIKLRMNNKFVIHIVLRDSSKYVVNHW